MYTLERYIKDNIALAGSLVIKVSDIARAMNLGVIKKYGQEIPTDKREWKYYKNLAGKKHFSNNDVKITLIETNERVSYTKELLYQYSYTRNELLKQDKYYKELIGNFPDDTMYINGCLYPVDEDVAISAKCGTILNYNRKFVEDNEYNLIKDLEDYIQAYLARWHVTEYTITDELYLPGLLATLYASIPNKLHNLRLTKINTTEVHSFHLEMFFKSNLDLWDELSVVKKETLYWLYKNLKYLMKNVGKEKTFKIIIDNIFKENNVGVGEFVIRKPNVSEDDLNQTDLSKSVYQDVLAITETRPLNSVYDIDANNVTDIKSLARLEMNTDTEITSRLTRDLIDHQVKKTNKSIEYLTFDNQKTKILDLNTNKLFEMNGVDIANLVIDIWGKAIKDNKYESLIYFTDENITNQDNGGEYKTLLDYVEPNSGETFSVTPKIGFFMLLKLLLKASGQPDLKLKKITFTNLLESDKNLFRSLRNNIWDDVYSTPTINLIESMLPQDLGIIKSPEEIKSYINDYIEFYKTVWVLDANAENFSVSENIKLLMNKATTYEDFWLTDNVDGIHIDDLLTINDAKYDIPDNFDIMMSISSLMEAFTGMKIDRSEQIKSNLKNFIKILNKLTSYTLHNVTGSDDTKTINIKYNNFSILRTENGVITTTDGLIHPLEYNFLDILAKGNDFLESITAQNFVDIRPTVRLCKEPIDGFCVISMYDQDIQVDYIQPSVSVQMRKPFVYDTTLCDLEQNFLESVSAVLHPLDNEILDTRGIGNNFDDAQGANYYIGAMANFATEELPYIQGTMYMGEENHVKPSHTVELSNTLRYGIQDSVFPEEQFISDIKAEIEQPLMYVDLKAKGKANTIGSEIKNDYDDSINSQSNEVDTVSGVGTYETNEEDIIVDIPDPIITGEID